MQILGRDMVKALRHKKMRGMIDGWCPVDSLRAYLKQPDPTKILACAWVNFRHRDGEFRFDRICDVRGQLWIKCIDAMDDADRGAGSDRRPPTADDEEEESWGKRWPGSNYDEVQEEAGRGECATSLSKAISQVPNMWC